MLAIIILILVLSSPLLIGLFLYWYVDTPAENIKQQLSDPNSKAYAHVHNKHDYVSCSGGDYLHGHNEKIDRHILDATANRISVLLSNAGHRPTQTIITECKYCGAPKYAAICEYCDRE